MFLCFTTSLVFRARSEKGNRIVIHVRTVTLNGTIVWSGQEASSPGQGDFLSVDIIGGYVQMSFNLGRNLKTTILTSKVCNSFSNPHGKVTLFGRIRMMRSFRMFIQLTLYLEFSPPDEG